MWLPIVTLISAFGIYTNSEQYILWNIMALTTNNFSSALKGKKSRSAQRTEAITYAYMTVVR